MLTHQKGFWRGDDSDKADECFDQAISYYDIVIGKENEFTALAYNNRGEAYLHKFDEDNALQDLETAKEMGMNIVRSFRNDYESVEEFEKINGEALRDDIAEMLTKKQ